MKTPSNEQLLTVCVEAAHATGIHAQTNLHRREEIVEQLNHDVKLIMDIECQRIAENVIQRHFPDHAILGEEGILAKKHAFEWIIDPIDGTANYARHLPTWCSSIAVRRNDKILAGCIFVPLLNECYSATIDSFAFRNGEKIHASGVSTLKKTTLFTGLTKDIDPRALHFFSDMAPRVNKIRMIGSAAIDICHVASGCSDGYYEPGLYRWDVAAAGLIAQRAGAVITEWPRAEKHGMRYLCTCSAIHDEIKQIVEKHFGKTPDIGVD